VAWLLDTNAVSEPGKPRPDRGFMAWYGSVEESDLFLSAITLGEVRRGVALLDPGPRRTGLEDLYSTLLRRFAAQLLAIDSRVAEVWGDLSARLKREGSPIGAADELIAATALAHDLVLVTRNRRHFEMTGCEVISPWSEVRG